MKYALWRIGIFNSPECRLPLAPLSDASKKAVDAALVKSGVLDAAKAKAAE